MELDKDNLLDVPKYSPTLYSFSNSNVFVSYIFATSKRHLNIYGERLFLELIRVARDYIIDQALGNTNIVVHHDLPEKYASINIPIRSLLNVDDSTNYTYAKNSAKSLVKLTHEFENYKYDSDGNIMKYKNGKPQYVYGTYPLFNGIEVNKISGMVTVKVALETWNAIVNMGKGYVRFNIQKAKLLNTPFAIRLYVIMCGQSIPFRIRFNELKEILGYSDKEYKDNIAGFVQKIIEPAENEIRKKSNIIVEHNYWYEDNPINSKKKIIGFIFKKVYHGQYRKDAKIALGEDVYNFLINTCKFDMVAINANLNLFLSVQNQGIDIISYISQVLQNINVDDILNPRGYIINSLKNLLNNEKMQQKSRSQDYNSNFIILTPESVNESNSNNGASYGLDPYSNSGLDEI